MADYYLGIDIAKATFDVAFIAATLPADPRRERPRTRHYANTAAPPPFNAQSGTAMPSPASA
jgi:hypothetical protein